MDVDGSESRSRREERKSSKPSNNTRDRSPLSKTARKGAPDRRVFVSNIPYEFRWQDLKDLFRDEGCADLSSSLIQCLCFVHPIIFYFFQSAKLRTSNCLRMKRISQEAVESWSSTKQKMFSWQ